MYGKYGLGVVIVGVKGTVIAICTLPPLALAAAVIRDEVKSRQIDLWVRRLNDVLLEKTTMGQFPQQLREGWKVKNVEFTGRNYPGFESRRP